jgi:hypothetical protein
MAEQPPIPANDPARLGSRARGLVFLFVLALVIWQGWMTLTLFGVERPWTHLLDDEFVLSGRHPLHLYHGYIGALSLRDRGCSSCYDPNFQAGYPKTPIFDGGSRPAELCLLLVGAGFHPGAYKVGLAVLCASVPLLVVLAGRGFGLRWETSCLATAFAQLAWWSKPGRDALVMGEVDLLLAGLAALCLFASLVRWDRDPGLLSAFGIFLCGSIGWYVDPLFFLVVVPPLALVYYVSVGGRHQLAWHIALATVLLGGVAINGFWLFEWSRSWWLRNPLQTPANVLPHRTFRTLWEAPLWGEPEDRALALLVLIMGILGVVWLNETRRRVSARILGLAAGSMSLLAVGGIAFEPLSQLGAAHLLPPALLFASIPAAHGLVEGFLASLRATEHPRRVAVCGIALLAAGGIAARQHVAHWIQRAQGNAPLELGLGDEQREMVRVLSEQTTPDARILWEDRPGSAGTAGWTALLPQLTGRSFLGGLDPDADIEHAYARLTEQALAGQALAEWDNKELATFCHRYNVGWVVCWSEATSKRFREWPDAHETAILNCETPGVLFTLPRSPRGFVLKGEAEWSAADSERIVLRNVRPEPGGDEVELSLHYQEGLRVTPSRVHIERVLDPRDPIPFIRLRVPGPVSCLTLTWDKR